MLPSRSLKLAARHTIHARRLTTGVGFDVLVRHRQPVTMGEQRLEVPKPMLRFDGCLLTQFPLHVTDIHRSIPPCGHAGHVRQKRLHAPALPPGRDFLALLVG